jgi:anti-sigma regulatory factor (Ser/Thr protein kinase)
MAGLGETAREQLALIVTELATNLIKHAGGGALIVRVLNGASALEVLALDRGVGIAHLDESFRDGFSTAGSAGTGLGAVSRLSCLLDVYSMRQGGTAIVSRLRTPKLSSATPDLWDVGAVCLPKTGEDVNGDAWSGAVGVEGSYSVLLVDGLGHGLGAADAARAAVRAFEARPELPPAVQVAAVHEALRGTRGAAVGVARINRRTATVQFAGVGNVAGSVISGSTSRQLVSLNGTAGHAVRRINEFSYPWPDDGLLVLHSDGLGSRWTLDRYPGLVDHHPALVAGVLFRDFNRHTDDVTILAARRHRL